MNLKLNANTIIILIRTVYSNGKFTLFFLSSFLQDQNNYFTSRELLFTRELLFKLLMEIIFLFNLMIKVLSILVFLSYSYTEPISKLNHFSLKKLRNCSTLLFMCIFYIIVYTLSILYLRMLCM